MIISLLFALLYFIISIYCHNTNDLTTAYIFFLLGLLNLAVWVAEYVVDRIKTHIDQKLNK